jgi:carbamoyl-phosphate synthase large subunit
VPFVSKATGVSLARIATRVIVGQKLRDMSLPGWDESVAGGRVPSRRDLEHVAVKEAVLPFPRFPGVDTTLGPEMKSTGEVMGIDDYSARSESGIGMAMVKAQIASYNHFPISGTAFISTPDKKKPAAVNIARRLANEGFKLLATEGTARSIAERGIPVEVVKKVGEGTPDVVDFIRDGKVDLVINVPEGRGSRGSGYSIRTAATMNGVPCITTIQLADIVIMGITALRTRGLEVKSLQEYHMEIARQDAERSSG